jgi:hypothetical protein
MKRAILLVLLFVTGGSSFAQMQQGTNYLSFNLNVLVLAPGIEKAAVYDRQPVTNADGDTIPLLIPANGGFRYHYAWTPNWSTGLTFFPSRKYTMAGIYGRYYFDLSAKRDYPSFFVHVGGLFQSYADDLGRVNYPGAEVLIGQTFRRTKEPFTYREIGEHLGEFFRTGKFPPNGYRGRWGWQYAVGASAGFSPKRKSLLFPQVQVGIAYYFDSKGWVKRP